MFALYNIWFSVKILFLAYSSLGSRPFFEHHLYTLLRSGYSLKDPALLSCWKHNVQVQRYVKYIWKRPFKLPLSPSHNQMTSLIPALKYWVFTLITFPKRESFTFRNGIWAVFSTRVHFCHLHGIWCTILLVKTNYLHLGGKYQKTHTKPVCRSMLNATDA